MVRFYCDRCNTEVEGPDDLVEVSRREPRAAEPRRLELALRDVPALL